MAALEERYATYRARCARLLGDALAHAGILVARGAGAAQGSRHGRGTRARSGSSWASSPSSRPCAPAPDRRGAAGQVYEGEFLGAVAIKQLFSSFIDPSDLDEFSREVTLLHKLKHPTCSRSASRRDVYCFIVTEHCPYALDALLRGEAPAARRGTGRAARPPRLSVNDRSLILFQVALALTPPR
ncbi:hypothetical protein JL720_4442 [Aureococcus anophagefferens]|nr:hypothetical protein JL720_4442 [Aureococcus anophagefferens]